MVQPLEKDNEVRTKEGVDLSERGLLKKMKLRIATEIECKLCL